MPEQIPPSLQQGDKIGVLSTARKIKKEELIPALKILESWGLEPILGKTIGLEKSQFAGTDQQRAADFQAMIDNPEIKAIICVRGGYGTVRILELLDFAAFAKSPKRIAGYSDVTALHSLLNRRLNVASIHSTMPVNFSNNTPQALQSLENVLFGKRNTYQFSANPMNKIGKTKAPVVGGNLSLLYSLTGTKYDIDTQGKILFLEDLDEYLYHIDRMMMNLKLAGKLAQIKGLIIGGMSDMNDNKIPFGKTAKEIIHEHTKDLEVPICFDFPAGHIDDNRAIILGKEATLNVGADKVTFEQ